MHCLKLTLQLEPPEKSEWQPLQGSVREREPCPHMYKVPPAQAPSAIEGSSGSAYVALQLPPWQGKCGRLEVTAIRLALVCLCGRDTDEIPTCDRLNIRVLSQCKDGELCGVSKGYDPKTGRAPVALWVLLVHSYPCPYGCLHTLHTCITHTQQR